MQPLAVVNDLKARIISEEKEIFGDEQHAEVQFVSPTVGEDEKYTVQVYNLPGKKLHIFYQKVGDTVEGASFGATRANEKIMSFKVHSTENFTNDNDVLNESEFREDMLNGLAEMINIGTL